MAHREEAERALRLLKGSRKEDLETPMELTLALQYAGRNPTAATITQFWDRSKDRMDVSEFAEVLRKVPPPSLDVIQRAFSKFDKNKDGLISYDELRQRMLRGDESLSEAEIDEIFSEMDANKDGSINYAEFVRHIEEARVAAVSRPPKARLTNGFGGGERRQKNPSSVNGQRRGSSSSSVTASPAPVPRRRKQVTHSPTPPQASTSKASEPSPPPEPPIESSGSPVVSPEPPIVSPSPPSKSSPKSSPPVFHLPPPPPLEPEVVESLVPPELTPMQIFKSRPDPNRLKDWTHIRRKGAFFYDEEMVLIGHRFSLHLSRSDLVWFSVTPMLPADSGPQCKLHDVIIMIVDKASGLVTAVSEEQDSEGVSHSRCKLKAGDYELIPWTSGLRFPYRDPAKGRRAELLEEGSYQNAPTLEHHPKSIHISCIMLE